MPVSRYLRPGHHRLRRIGAAAALTIVLAAVGAVGTALAAAPAAVAEGQSAPSAPASPDVKFWVVAPERNGHQEFLFEIAQKALGDGNRYTEIFNLNKGRPQPGGGQLTDPAVLEPGWVLLLPDDAHGPGVHSGPLPTSAPAQRTAVPPTSGPEADPSAANGGPAANEAVERPAPVLTRLAIGGAVGLAVALLLGLGYWLIRRRAAADDGPDGPWPSRPVLPAGGSPPPPPPILHPLAGEPAPANTSAWDTPPAPEPTATTVAVVSAAEAVPAQAVPEVPAFPGPAVQAVSAAEEPPVPAPVPPVELPPPWPAAPFAGPAVIAKPASPAEAAPVAEPAPGADPAPVADLAPLAEPGSYAVPGLLADPTPQEEAWHRHTVAAAGPATIAPAPPAPRPSPEPATASGPQQDPAHLDDDELPPWAGTRVTPAGNANPG